VWRKNKNYSILILGAADEALLNKVHKKLKKSAFKTFNAGKNAYPLYRFGIFSFSRVKGQR
jgi:hypothetical protein